MSTVVALVADLVEKGKTPLKSGWVDAQKRNEIRAACERVGMEWLKPIKEALPEAINYDEIRLVVAELRRAGKRD